MLVGKRVLLRPVKKEDVDLFLKWFNDPEVTRTLLFYLPLTREAEEKWIENANLSDSTVVLTIEVKGEKGAPNVVIGNCGLHSINWKDRKATFGIALGKKDLWKNGYGTEASELLLKYGFETLNLNRISSSAISFNERSLKMHKRLGFQKEGTFKKSIFKEGRYHDEILFGLLKSRWNNQKKNKK